MRQADKALIWEKTKLRQETVLIRLVVAWFIRKEKPDQSGNYHSALLGCIRRQVTKLSLLLAGDFSLLHGTCSHFFQSLPVQLHIFHG